MQYTNPIIPVTPKEVLVNDSGTLDLKALCIFVAIGFFLDDDTYWTHKKILRPATKNVIDDTNVLLTSNPYFNWHYTPRDISFKKTLEEFTELFETIVKEQTQGQSVILPLSGGLDSRSQATALKYLDVKVNSYSYEFQNGYPETKIAGKIARFCGFDFRAFTIQKGYLWNKLDELVKLNQCYSDFTSPRQLAISHEFSKMGDIFSLGHWGDVLFDNFRVTDMSHEDQVKFLVNKLLKRGGFKLAETLWNTWNLEGDFEAYFTSRLSEALSTIDIKNTNARLRAFKSKYWAPRWTSVNLSVFENEKPITLPYYDNRMCEFICTVPEAYLANRQLQIAYIKKRNPKLAKITWQTHRPFNLYTYNNNKPPNNLPYRTIQKLKRISNAVLGKSYIQRNWELQLLGKSNKDRLLLELEALQDFVPKAVIKQFTKAFYNGKHLENAHPINMLLVLAKFNQKIANGPKN